MEFSIKGLDKLKRLAEGFSEIQKRAPKKLGNIAVNFYKGSFNRQGWIDNAGVEKWKKRKAPPGRRKDTGRAVMVKSGRLRRSIRITASGPGYVRIGTDVPYARAHNEGEKITQTIVITPKMRRFFWAMWYATKEPKWKALALKKGPIRREFTMPQRKFMGDSNFLQRRLLMNMEYEFKELFKRVL